MMRSSASGHFFARPATITPSPNFGWSRRQFISRKGPGSRQKPLLDLVSPFMKALSWALGPLSPKVLNPGRWSRAIPPDLSSGGQDPKMEKIPITVVVPVLNEALNLGRCLAELGDFEEVVVVDFWESRRDPRDRARFQCDDHLLSMGRQVSQETELDAPEPCVSNRLGVISGC